MILADRETPSPVLQQHVEEAASLWLLRDTAISDPHYSLADLAYLDGRVEAHNDGLRIAGDFAWRLCSNAMQSQEAGDIFTAAVLALVGNDGKRLTEVLDVATESPEHTRGLISALGWVETDDFNKWAPGILRSHSPLHIHAAIAGLGVRREEMAREIEDALEGPDVSKKFRALRAIGETKKRTALPMLREQLESDNETCRFWAAWSSVLLGDSSVAKSLKTFVNFKTPFAIRAVQLAPRVLDLGDSQQWLRGLAQDESLRRFALKGCGVTGDPVYIPTLINQMSVPEYARVAGEAFSMITGVDLAYEDLDTDQPEDFEAGPTEDPADENVDLDPDEDLPWPDQELIDRWWHEHSREYQTGVHYLCGRPITDENCRRVLREGYQRQRISAAYELALMNPDEPLFEWRAPGFRQQEWLGLRKPSRRYRR
jgi:uncharacterized protein (TIGR02270 family)